MKIIYTKTFRFVLTTGMLALSYLVLDQLNSAVSVFLGSFLFAGLIAFLEPWPCLSKWLGPFLAFAGTTSPVMILLPHHLNAFVDLTMALVYGTHVWLLLRIGMGLRPGAKRS